MFCTYNSVLTIGKLITFGSNEPISGQAKNNFSHFHNRLWKDIWIVAKTWSVNHRKKEIGPMRKWNCTSPG